MCVSSSSFCIDFFDIFANSSGIPAGCPSSLKGLGGFFTPGIGISLALEKVAQLGAQCSNSDFSKSSCNSLRCLKMHLPLRMSQGSKTLSPLGEQTPVPKASLLLCAACVGLALFADSAAAVGNRPCPYDPCWSLRSASALAVAALCFALAFI